MSKKRPPQQVPPESSLTTKDNDEPDKKPPGTEEVIRALRLQAESRHFSGPIPPPEILKEYNDILPGSAERILKMAEAQSAHRQAMEKSVISSDTFRANAGLWLGGGVAALSVCTGSALVGFGHDVAGTAIATAVVVSLVGVFVYGSISRRHERSGKQMESD